jgi:hypothetical protein
VDTQEAVQQQLSTPASFTERPHRLEQCQPSTSIWAFHSRLHRNDSRHRKSPSRGPTRSKQRLSSQPASSNSAVSVVDQPCRDVLFSNDQQIPRSARISSKPCLTATTPRSRKTACT